MNDKILHCISKNLWCILTGIAQNNHTVSYCELKHKTGLNDYYLGLVIRNIALCCFHQHWPILSSVIDNPTTQEYCIRNPWSHRESALSDVYYFDWKIISNPFRFTATQCDPN